MKLLFDGTDGARFIFGRIPIGASDFAIDRYTLNETANDFTMANFSIARDRIRLIPYIKAALALNANIRLWASPWTPPTWMKDNEAFDGGNMEDNAQNLQALALYLAKFVQEYGKEGIKIEAIHHQNEPNYATGYPSCLWTPALYTKFIGMYLGPTFASQNVTAQIYLGTMSNADAGKDTTIIGTVLADATALSYVKGFGLQWNMINSVSGLTGRNLPILQTEHKCGNYPWETATFKSDKAPNDHAYGVESFLLIRDWLKAGVHSYSAWNMVLDTIGKGNSTSNWPQNALLTVDRTAKTLTATPAYYVFRHFSQYVDAGRQARRDHRHGGGHAGVQEPRRQHRRGHVQRRHRGPDDDGRHRHHAPAVLHPRQRLRDDQAVAPGPLAPRSGRGLGRGVALLHLDDLVLLLAVLFDRLVVGLAELHVLLLADRDLFAALRKLLDDRAGLRRDDLVVAAALLVVGAAVIVVVVVHDRRLRRQRRHHASDGRRHHRVAAAGGRVPDALVVAVLRVRDAHDDGRRGHRRDERAERAEPHAEAVGPVSVIAVRVVRVVATSAVRVGRPPVGAARWPHRRVAPTLTLLTLTLRLPTLLTLRLPELMFPLPRFTSPVRPLRVAGVRFAAPPPCAAGRAAPVVDGAGRA